MTITPEQSAYFKQYRKLHAERYKAQREARKEHDRAVYAIWYAKNAEKKRTAAREWGEKNREYKRQKMREYMKEYSRRPESIERRQRTWRLYEHNARTSNGSFTLEQLDARWDFYGGRCAYCGAEATTIDHVIPISRGGSNWPANIRPACLSCNSRKQDLSLSAFLERRQHAA